MTEVIQDLVRKRWVIKRRSVADGRAFRLRLSRRGEAITRAIQHQVGQTEAHAKNVAASRAYRLSVRPLLIAGGRAWPWGYTNSSIGDAKPGQDCRVNRVTSILPAALL